MGNGYGYAQTTLETSTWTVKANVSPTIVYLIKKGSPIMVKTTGTPENAINYEVDAVNGKMSLTKDKVSIEAGADGNLLQLVQVLKSMVEEIEKYIAADKKVTNVVDKY